jgi:hypothetical protein
LSAVTGGRELRGELLLPDAILLGAERVHLVTDGRELLDGGHAVGLRLGDPTEDLLLQPGDADHEELVEVRRDDADELEPLVEGQGGVARLLEHALVEGQPGQLAVEEQPRPGLDARLLGWFDDLQVIGAPRQEVVWSARIHANDKCSTRSWHCRCVC